MRTIALILLVGCTAAPAGAASGNSADGLNGSEINVLDQMKLKCDDGIVCSTSDDCPFNSQDCSPISHLCMKAKCLPVNADCTPNGCRHELMCVEGKCRAAPQKEGDYCLSNAIPSWKCPEPLVCFKSACTYLKGGEDCSATGYGCGSADFACCEGKCRPNAQCCYLPGDYSKKDWSAYCPNGCCPGEGKFEKCCE